MWNEVTILWNELTILWNDLTWNDLTMERNDRIPLITIVGHRRMRSDRIRNRQFLSRACSMSEASRSCNNSKILKIALLKRFPVRYKLLML